VGERLTRLEMKFEHWEERQDEISEKLQSLLDLKLKGMGALWFVWIIVGSGILGLLTTVWGFFQNRPHL